MSSHVCVPVIAKASSGIQVIAGSETEIKWYFHRRSRIVSLCVYTSKQAMNDQTPLRKKQKWSSANITFIRFYSAWLHLYTKITTNDYFPLLNTAASRFFCTSSRLFRLLSGFPALVLVFKVRFFMEVESDFGSSRGPQIFSRTPMSLWDAWSSDEEVGVSSSDVWAGDWRADGNFGLALRLLPVYPPIKPPASHRLPPALVKGSNQCCLCVRGDTWRFL